MSEYPEYSVKVGREVFFSVKDCGCVEITQGHQPIVHVSLVAIMEFVDKYRLDGVYLEPNDFVQRKPRPHKISNPRKNRRRGFPLQHQVRLD